MRNEERQLAPLLARRTRTRQQQVVVCTVATVPVHQYNHCYCVPVASEGRAARSGRCARGSYVGGATTADKQALGSTPPPLAQPVGVLRPS